ncbi:hypothetical protein F4776DRAFT_619341 [Hypoxylon sp. NC0597]|nr:hypothetical protein F4776DRAFT_619341 [Hypoxylon sp. NC0597]
MDPVSLALGIAPLCISAIKGLTLLASKLKLFRHHCKEIKQIRKKLKIQGGWFRDELHLLLLKVVDAQVVTAMMDDHDHPQWRDKEFEAKMKSHLGDKYDSFQETVDEVRETIEDLLDKLSSFAPSETAAPLSKSTRDAFRITFRKQEYMESLEALKESNAELRRLRKTASKIKINHSRICHLPIPSGYEAVQSMSSSLYNLLRTRSSCNADANSHHSITLMLNSTDETTPNINLFFEHKLFFQRVSLPIHASCKGLEYGDSGLLTPESSPGVGQSPKRRRAHSTHHSQKFVTNRPIAMHVGRHDECDGEDLMKTGVRCEQLIIASAICPGALPRSLGYLDVKDRRRVVLYPGLQGLGEDSDRLKLREATPILDYLKFPAYDVVSDKDRLRLAITLVKSMLKYNSTPWWPQEWTLRQVYVLCKGDRDLSSSLNTLHLSTHIEPTQSASGGNQSLAALDGENHPPDSLPLESVQYAMENYGIRNLTLYGLGVALLQIGLWDHVPWEDHVQVRRKVARLSYLGKRYRDATKRLIDCDFGLATEKLDDVKLQSAIFTDIVGDLEALFHGEICSGV